ncbi:MAG: PASTA domain-containing protein [Chthonomonas sp.]|nr:PASTA domain-containing protein [Chthonomonas sp.]
MIGTVLSMRYELMKETERSPLFRVFKARDRVVGRDVVVRVLDEPFASEEPFLTALSEVVQRSISLPHPNIERMLELQREDGVSYLVSEFSPGVPLAERIGLLAPFSPGVALGMISDICLGLMMLHESGVTHGDLSSRNIMVGPDNRVRITLAGMWTSFSHSRTAGAVVLPMMAPYLAPDITRGEMPSPSTDMYAVGVLLFELLTGKMPYPGDNAMAIAVKQSAEPIPSAVATNSSVPMVLDKMLQKVLAKSKGERYPDIRSLLADIRIVQDGLRFGRQLAWPLVPDPQDTAAQAEPDERVVVPASIASRIADIPKTVAISTSPKVDAGAASRPQPKPEDAGLIAPRMGAVRDKMKPEETPIEISDSIPKGLRMLLILITLMLLVLAGSYVFWNLTKPKEIRMPKVTFISASEADKKLKMMGLKMRVIKRQIDQKYSENTVLETNPSANQAIKQGSTVNVIISAGTGFVEVPDLVGRSVEEAKQTLTTLGLQLREPVKRAYDDKVREGNIIEQRPRAKVQIERNAGKVAVTVSRGKFRDAAEGEGGGKTQKYTIRLTMPEGQPETEVQITVVDADGERSVFSERLSGQSATRSIEVEAAGDEPEYRVYYDGQLVDQKPLKESRR